MGYYRKNKPTGFWHDLENVRKEVMQYIEEVGGLPNCAYFKRIGRLDIQCGIYRYGGYEKLANDLNVPFVMTVYFPENGKKPVGYWQNWDNFKKELEPIIQEFGTIPSAVNVRKINQDIEYAFRHFGGFVKVREMMNLPKLYANNKTQPHNYWGNLENVKKALEPIIAEHGNIPSTNTMREKYGRGLSMAIQRYHGGFIELRKKLGLPEHVYDKTNCKFGIYRESALKHYGHICYICGFVAEVSVHHIDSNRLNNKIENLIVLCPNHHSMLHRGIITDIEEYKKNYNELRLKEYE